MLLSLLIEDYADLGAGFGLANLLSVKKKILLKNAYLSSRIWFRQLSQVCKNVFLKKKMLNLNNTPHHLIYLI